MAAFSRKGMLWFALLVGASLIEFGCAAAPATYRKNPQLDSSCKNIKTYGLVKPRVEVCEISAGGVKELRDDWCNAARGNVVAALERQFSSKMINLKQTATAQLKARTLELEHREQLLQKVFQTVAGRLGEVPQRKDYPRIALTLVREALSQLRTASAVVRIDKATRDALAGSDLEALARELGIEVVLGEILDNGTGPVAQTVDQRLQFDNTLETRLTRMQGALRAAVYRILIGESE